MDSGSTQLYGNPRRVLDWKQVRGWRRGASLWIGTGLGSGLVPVAPGTAGTAVGLILAFSSSGWSTSGRLALWIGLTILGTWACKVYEEMMQSHDNQNLVIDEVVGMGITSWTLSSHGSAHENSLAAWLAAFVIFRVFDILKLPPVRQLDRWSKSGASWWGAIGVMADDVAAGFQGLLVMILLQKGGFF